MTPGNPSFCGVLMPFGGVSFKGGFRPDRGRMVGNKAENGTDFFPVVKLREGTKEPPLWRSGRPSGLEEARKSIREDMEKGGRGTERAWTRKPQGRPSRRLQRASEGFRRRQDGHGKEGQETRARRPQRGGSGRGCPSGDGAPDHDH